MAKLDRIKEFINYLKVLLVLLLATNVGLIGWIVNNYKMADSILIYLAIIIVLIILLISVMINKKIIKDIKSLEDL
jgi:membrane protein YdbS with pleckstrin-like domain